MKSSYLAMLLALGGAYSAAGEASTYWVPFAAPETSGANNLYVVPSTNPAATPALVGRFGTLLSGSVQVTTSSTDAISSYAPYAAIYLAPESDGTQHVYGLNLTNLAATPKAQQLSNLALTAPAVVCPLLQTPMATNAFQPSTAFVLLHTNTKGAADCDKSGDVYQVVQYSDSTSTAPKVVDISIRPYDDNTLLPGMVTPIYESNGDLGGVVLVSGAGDLEYFAGSTFASPTVITTGVTSAIPMYFGAPDAPPVTANVGFFAVTTSSGPSVWRVSSSGKAQKVWFASGAGGGTVIGGFASDSKNLYFVVNETTATSKTEGTTVQQVYQLSLSGAGPLILYTAPAVLSGPTMIGQLGLTLIGSNGSSLVLQSVQMPKTTIENSVVTLPVGTSEEPATTTIAGPIAGLGSLQVMLCTTAYGDPASQDVLLNSEQVSSSDEIVYSSEVVATSGKIIQAPLANSVFMSTVAGLDEVAPMCPSNSGLIAQVRGITATDGSYGGGSVNEFNLDGDTVTALKTSSGAGYTIPDGKLLGGNGFFSSTGTKIAGYVGTPSAPFSPAPEGLAIDFTKGVIATFTLPKANVQPLF
jgi:hypothetical protein